MCIICIRTNIKIINVTLAWVTLIVYDWIVHVQCICTFVYAFGFNGQKVMLRCLTLFMFTCVYFLL